jgi:hypothetical protein
MLIIGAGLSAGLVPFPTDLLSVWCPAAEEQLGIDSIPIDDGKEEAFYEWAEHAIKALVEKEVAIPKLRLAEALGLLTERKWTAKVGLPLRGTLPRHRVVARLIRERKWASIWSLNWDTQLENALERIGLLRNNKRPGQPWITAYRTIITIEDFRFLSETEDLFCILKPHGCVCALLEAQKLEKAGDTGKAGSIASRLMITKEELDKERDNPTDKKFFEQFRAQLNISPLVVLGWSISEVYINNVMGDAIRDLIIPSDAEDLTIIDIDFNDKGHKITTEQYDLELAQVFMQVDRDPRGFDCDCFFSWLQARYAIDQLQKHGPQATKNHLLSLKAELSRPVSEHFLLSWADSFLPAWVRLCWRSELVSCAGFEPHQLRMELEDEHIPWDIPALPRPDLSAAAMLLYGGPLDQQLWDFDRFPGGAFERDSGRLILPLPAWGRLSDLAALRPLLQVLARDIAFVDSLEILPVPSGHGQPRPSEGLIVGQKELLAAHMRVGKFADPTRLGTAEDFNLWVVH